ncbi:MAG: CCA tRNA nucleotidyltransferase [Candidatus Micrarchaeota archaeon]|nr:CCA tRNA nucleotidyltransferase [Candidatus Micrarchaeota archaeon]
MDRADELAAQKVFAAVLPEIKPDANEIRQATAHVNTLTTTLAKIVPRDVELHVAGSIARGTNLKGAADFDIFMLFPKQRSKEAVEKQGVAYGKALAKKLKGTYEIKYAEHPYIRVFAGPLKLRADIVPAYKISDIEEMGTAVDRTPLHTAFINSSFTGRQKDDTRLLKALLKAHHIYGAEVKTNGFSGYLCELLIYNYGTLLKLLENAAAFTLPLVISPKRSHFDGNREAAVRRFNSQFIVIDPVDVNRNVAAGVSLESLSRFTIVAREFLSKPSVKAFKGHVNELRHHGTYADFLDGSGLDSFVVEVKVSDKSDDVVFPQLRKIATTLKEHAERLGFNVYLALPSVMSGKGYILILAQKTDLRTRLIKGPDAFMPKAVSNFIKAHKVSDGFIIRGSTVFALDRNRYGSMDALISDVLKMGMARNSGDVKLKTAKVYSNRLPKGAEALAAELEKKLRV